MAGGALFPFEFFVAAVPRSMDASPDSRQRWKAQLQEAARRRVAELVEFPWLDDRPLALSVYYFPPTPMVGDIDNVIKPIMDALVGVAYIDDRVVERVLAQKFEPGVKWSFAQSSQVLAAALLTATPVVYVRVDDDLSWGRN
jgi:crossover junction endodeoxyribonuclease RusA